MQIRVEKNKKTKIKITRINDIMNNKNWSRSAGEEEPKQR